MKHFLMAVAAAAALIGCATPLDGLLDSRYSEVRPAPAPSQMVGTWTGNMGPYLLTLQVESDGTGLYCYSWNEKHAVNRLKYDGERLVFQDGARAEVVSASSEKLVLRPSYEHSSESVLRDDQELREASPFCATEL
ncbi:MAG: J517_1871 family lipoprotein [Alcanivorax sp.]